MRTDTRIRPRPALADTGGHGSVSTAAVVEAAVALRRPTFSFEFFPPKTDDGERQLWRAIRELEALGPTFVSVTYGAGGSTRDRTVRITERIAAETTLDPVAHLTCVGASVADLRGVIGQYADAGVHTVLALRGDPPGGPGAPWVQHPDGLAHADELVRLVDSLGDFSIGVAAFPEGHPESPDLDHDARVLAAKQEAGARFAITQFFFEPECYIDLLERSRAVGCTMPIIPGIMPITDARQVIRFAELSGTQVPDDLARKVLAVADDADAVRAIGTEAAAHLCRELLAAGAPGLHFYTLNRSTATREIYADLGVARWSELHGGYDPSASVLPRLWLSFAYMCARPLVRLGVGPNAVTVLGLVVALAVLIPAAAGGRWLLLVPLIVIASGLLDNLDGAVAVLTGRTTRWGAVLDSVADRVSDAGYVVALWLVGAPPGVCVVAGALMGLQEYARARAAASGMDEIGVVTVWERPTRVIVTAMFLLGAGIYPSAASTWATAGAWAWAVLGAVGLVQLLVVVRRRLS